jgi:hypothetical protein
MDYLVFLNEVKAGSSAGGTDVFSSVDALAHNVEAIDIANGEYRCFTSEGEAVVFDLVPNPKYPKDIELARVSATLVPAPEQQEVYQSILYDYLTQLSANNLLRLQPDISAQTELKTLASFVPRKFVSA